MSMEYPHQGKKSKEGHEQSLAERAFADWCAVNNVAQKEVPHGVSFDEKVMSFDWIFHAGARKFLDGFIAQQEGSRLDLVALKSELDSLREQGNFTAVGAKEQEIAKSFQEIISAYKYESATNYPKDILAKKEMNCVGATLIGGMLLEEVGIRSVQASGGSHCFTIVATSDNRVLWQDMQDGLEASELFNQELTSEKLKGANPHDIVEFARNPEGSMKFEVEVGRWKDKAITIKPFFPGIEVQELINTGFMLTNAGKHEEALEVLEIAEQKAPEDTSVYLGLAKALHRLGRYEEALVRGKKAFEVDPTNSYAQDEIDEIRKQISSR